MNLFSIISIVSAATNIILAIFLLNKGWDNPLRRIWGGAAISIAVWGIGGSIFSIIPQSQYERALFWWQFAYTGIIFIPVFYTHFVFQFLNIKNKVFLIAIYLLGCIFLILNWYNKSSLFLGDLKFVFGQFYWHDWLKSKSIFYLSFYIIFYWLLLAYASAYLFIHFKKTKGIVRNQFKYVILGSIAGWIGGQSNFVSDFGFRSYPYLNLLTAFYAPVLAYGIVIYRVMDIRVALTRAGIFVFVYSFIFALPIWFGFKTQAWLWSVILMGISSPIGIFVYSYLREQAEKFLLKEQTNYQAVLKELAKTMIQIRTLDDLLNIIVLRISDAIQPQFIAFYIFSKEDKAYILKHNRTQDNIELDKEISIDSELVNYLEEYHRSILVEETNFLKFPLETVAIPCYIQDGLFAFIVLGPKPKKSLYTASDFVIFDILSSQASLAIENCIFWQEEKTRLAKEEQIKRMQAMDHFSAAMAHEIDNPITAISGQLRLIKLILTEKFKNQIPSEDLAELAHYSDTTVTNLERISKMIKAVREFSRQDVGDFTLLNIDEVVDFAFAIVGPQVKYKKVELVKEVKEHFSIKGNKIYLAEVLINLIVNSLHAVKDKPEWQGKIILTVHSGGKAKGLIEVSDNGYGIKKELLEDIFLDFVTTKASSEGTGMGLARVRKIIQMHNGKVWAKSEGKEKGATFCIELPLI
ncbi:MAG: ATP-binding protein [Candidatus Omnitrophota bacterium]|nr:ATP-binding protein [Candidatus Omnitrophota bacterium]